MPTPDPEAPETYESALDPSSTASEYKFYQVVVPNFDFNQTGDATGVTRSVPNVANEPALQGSPQGSGSSFLRLGSFPDVSQVQNGPAGFANSLALANLVGNAAAIAAIAAVPSTYDGTDPNSAVANVDSAPCTTAGDNSYLLGFVDDTRVRDAPFTPVPPDTAPPRPSRLAETLTLLTKGGWWDHSDGNRISTTIGDKVEIIQGNYKLLVLGRQPLPNPSHSQSDQANELAYLAQNSEIYDVSGGIVSENNVNPDALIKSVEYTQDLDGTWTQYENAGPGSVYASFFGKSGDLFQGPLQESWTGLPPGDFPQTDFYSNTLAQVSPPSTMATDPDVKEYTWANSITTYTGSEGKTIPSITEYTFADSITTQTGSLTKPVHTITESTYADAVTTLTTVPAISEVTTATTITGETNAVAITEITAAGVVVDITVAAVKADVFVGALCADLQLGFKLDIHAGGKFEMDLGGGWELSYPTGYHIDLGEKLDAALLKTTAVAGANTTTVAGSNTSVSPIQTIVGAMVNLGMVPAPPVVAPPPSTPATPSTPAGTGVGGGGP
jgi:hypothetical protein